MTDREWRATHCVECHGTSPDEGWHERCGCHEIPTGTDVSAGQRGNMGVRKTAPDECANTPEGLTTNDCVGVAMASPNHTRTSPPRDKNRGGV